MKIVLRRGTNQISLVRAAEARTMDPPIGFTDEHHALSLLLRYFDDEGAVVRLRRELFESYERTQVMGMDRYDVLREMARLLARGIMRAVYNEVELPRVYLESDKATAGKRTTGKGDGKTLPSPIVPPEYPILARRESDQVVSSTRQLTALLDKQLHDLFKRLVPPSQVAPEYVSAAEETGQKVDRAVFDLKTKIEEYLYRGMSARPEPSLPPELVAVAESEAAQIKSSIEAMTKVLDRELYDGRPIEMPKPEIAPAIVAVAESEAEAIKGSIQAMIGSLKGQLYPFDSDTFRAPGGVEAAAAADG